MTHILRHNFRHTEKLFPKKDHKREAIDIQPSRLLSTSSSATLALPLRKGSLLRDS